MSISTKAGEGPTRPVRSRRASLRRTLVVLAFALLVVAGGVAFTIGARLFDIEHLARETKTSTIPESVSQNRHALEAERLTRYAELVLREPNDAVRHETAELAERLAADLANGVDGRLKSSVDEAARLIAETAEATHLANHRSRQLLARVADADKLIAEIDDILAVLVDDSSYWMRQILEESAAGGMSEGVRRSACAPVAMSCLTQRRWAMKPASTRRRGDSKRWSTGWSN
jgi:hypothetical protein